MAESDGLVRSTIIKPVDSWWVCYSSIPTIHPQPRITILQYL